MNGKDNMNNIFGSNPVGKVRELSEINTDAWPLISASPVQRGTAPKPQQTRRPSESQGRPAQNQGRKPAEAPKKNKSDSKEKKKSGYVGAKTGLGKKKTAEKPAGRISEPPKGKGRRPEEKEVRTNKKPSSANNMKRPPQRTPQGERVAEPRGRTQPQRPERGKSSLTKQQEKQIRKQKAIYEEGRRQGKSKDEIRREQQRKQIKKRKRKSFMAFIAFVAVISIGLGFYIYNNVALVKNINVEGGSTYSVKKIVKTSGVLEGDRLLAVREKRIREILTTELPYIKDAEISYKFPDTLTITVVPTQDKLLLVEKNKYLRLDKDGKVLSSSKTKMKDGLYKIEGLTYKKHETGSVYVPVTGEESKYEMAKSVALEAEKAGLSKGTVNVSDLQKITFTYEGRIRIYLGDAEDLAEKLEFAYKTIELAAPDKQTGYIDMRFSERGYFSEGSMDNT